MLSVAMIVGFASCEDDFGPEHNGDNNGGGGATEELATVTTNNVTSITANSAICGGNVSSDGGSTITARGICWSTSQNPTTEDDATYSGTGIGSFTANITGLEAGTTYHVRAYAVNSKGTAYGTQKTFTTTTTGGGGGSGGSTTTTINGHEWVDLGLPSGLKWATCNIGASQPHDYGNYYAWGETTTKTEYINENSVTQGQSMNDISGNATYDAARANWGSTWRISTKTEMEELVDNCTWTWITQSNINGMRVTGPNGNSIFLPAAGICGGTSRYYVGGNGYYCTSTPYQSNYNNYFFQLNFYIDYHGVGKREGRSYGLTVRPVSD